MGKNRVDSKNFPGMIWDLVENVLGMVFALAENLPFSQMEPFYLGRGTIGPEDEVANEKRSVKMFVTA